MKRKGFKKAKGEPAYWSEIKRNLNLSVTPTAIEGLEKLAQQHDLSKSELVEQIGRGLFTIARTDTPQSV